MKLTRDTVLPKLPESEEDVTRFRQESIQEAEDVRKSTTDDIDHLYIYTKPSYVNLKVKRASASTVTVEWSALLIGDTYHEDPNGFTKTLDIITDLDTGGKAASTWYYIWAIATEDGRASCIFSVSSDDPVYPANYVHRRLVSMVYNSAGGNFVDFTQENEMYMYSTWLLALNNGGAGAPAVVPLTVFVPEAVYWVNISMYCDRNIAGTQTLQAYVLGYVNDTYIRQLRINLLSYSQNWHTLVEEKFIFTSNRNIQYYQDPADGVYIYVGGFKVEL